MQRTEGQYVVISCDFCGQDWDEVLPMIEGHHGSVLCLACLDKALAQKRPAVTWFDCTLCLQRHEADTVAWTPMDRPLAANQHAMACQSCLHQAARAFTRDPDVDWTWQRDR